VLNRSFRQCHRASRPRVRSCSPRGGGSPEDSLWPFTGANLVRERRSRTAAASAHDMPMRTRDRRRARPSDLAPAGQGAVRRILTIGHPLRATTTQTGRSPGRGDGRLNRGHCPIPVPRVLGGMWFGGGAGRPRLARGAIVGAGGVPSACMPPTDPRQSKGRGSDCSSWRDTEAGGAPVRKTPAGQSTRSWIVSRDVV
jgi:hypothetical protein